MREVEDFLADGYERVGWTRDTVAGYRSHLAQIVAFATARLGRDPEPADVTADLVQRFDTARARSGNKQRSRAARQACYRSFVKWLCRVGKVTAEQCEAVASVPRIRVNEKPRRHYVRSGQVRAMIDVCPQVAGEVRTAYRGRLASAVLHVLAFTGARRSDVCALAISDIDLSASPPSITFRASKGGKCHRLPLHRDVVAALKLWIDRRPTDSPSLFAVPVLTRAGGARAVVNTKLTPARIVGILRQCARLAEIIDVDVCKPHAYRRFAASNLLRCGASLKVVSEFLGHSSLDVTEKYISSDPEELAESIERMTLAPSGPPRQTEQKRFRIVRRISR